MEPLLTILLLVAAGLFLPGMINRTRAVLSGRKGIRFFQHIYNAGVMLKKGVVTGHTSTVLFTVAPSVYLGTIFTALLFVPLGGCAPLFHFNGDVVMFAYLLAFSRLAMILAALDTGSSFEGMGASRDALYGAMVEPALFIVAGTLALVSGVTSFSGMFTAIASAGLSPEMVIVMLLLVYVIMKIITVECGRIPVDDPRTHLELTMIHEVMILDYSGVDLAMIMVGGWLKMAALSALGANIVAAVTGGGVVASFIYTVLAGVGIGVVESFVARNKLARNSTFIFTIVAIAFVLFLVAFMLRLDIKIGY